MSVPLPLGEYDEKKQIEAPKGHVLRELLEEDERLTAAYTGELGRLQAELQRKTKDTTDMVKYLEAEVRRKDLMSKRMTKQLTDLGENHTADLTMMRRQFENTCKYMEKIFLEKEKQIMDKNALLEAQIKALSDLQAARTALATELEQTKSVIFSNERTHKLQLDELEKRFLAARDGLQREAAGRIAQSRATYKMEVGRELEQESTAVRLENEKLRERLRTHEVTSDRLQKSHASFTQRIHSLKQDLELRQQQNEEYLRKSLRQNKAIEELTKAAKAAEEELISSLRQREENRLKKEQQHEMALAPLQRALQLARNQGDAIDAENRSLRRKAKRCLQEKRETSEFFLRALEETRENLKRKKELQRREKELLQQAQLRELTLPASLRTKLPFIHSSSQASGESPYGGQNVFTNPNALDLGDLTLEDREKVLRLLYAKIAHIPSGITVTLPQHSFDIAVAGANVEGRQQGLQSPFIPMLQMPSTESQPARRSLPASAGPSDPPQLLAGDQDGVGGGAASSSDETFITSVPSRAPSSRGFRAASFITNLDVDDGEDSQEEDPEEAEAEERMRELEMRPRSNIAKQTNNRPTSSVDETD